jgi:hypothetical protein
MNGRIEDPLLKMLQSMQLLSLRDVEPALS